MRQLLIYALCCLLLSSIAYGQTRSCSNTRNTFESLRVLDANGQSSRLPGVIFDQLKSTGLRDGVCKLSQTCCSSEAEESLKMSTEKDRHDEVIESLSELMECRVPSVFTAFRKFINDSKTNLISDMYRAFTFYFEPYERIYDTFYEYLINATLTGETCQLRTEFNLVSFEVFLASYVGINAAPFPDDREFQQCVYDFFLDFNRITLDNTYNGFTRAYDVLLRYLRAVRLVESVVDSVLSHELNSQCRNALMKMTYCSQCAGYPMSNEPCQSLCLNTMRGCLLDLADLEVPIRQLSEAMVRVKDALVQTYQPWQQITLLASRFFQLVTATSRNSVTIQQQIGTRCGTGNSNSQSKRQAPSNRFTRITLIPPTTELNTSAHCLNSKLSLFNSLPEALCGKNQISTGNDNCWTGRTVGSYERNVIAYNRMAQRNNPEVLICSKTSSFSTEIAKMKYVTRELNSITQSLDCSPDDEDCNAFTIKETCHYYDITGFESIDSCTGSGCGASSGSGSGSGSGDGDECEFATQTPPTSEEPTLQTTSTDSSSTTASTTSPTTPSATPSTTRTTASPMSTTQKFTEPGDPGDGTTNVGIVDGGTDRTLPTDFIVGSGAVQGTEDSKAFILNFSLILTFLSVAFSYFVSS